MRRKRHNCIVFETFGHNKYILLKPNAWYGVLELHAWYNSSKNYQICEKYQSINHHTKRLHSSRTCAFKTVKLTLKMTVIIEMDFCIPHCRHFLHYTGLLYDYMTYTWNCNLLLTAGLDFELSVSILQVRAWLWTTWDRRRSIGLTYLVRQTKFSWSYRVSVILSPRTLRLRSFCIVTVDKTHWTLLIESLAWSTIIVYVLGTEYIKMLLYKRVEVLALVD